MAKETVAVAGGRSEDGLTNVNACVSTIEGSRASKGTSWREWVVANQIGGSLSILAAILAVHTFVPSLRAYTTPYLELPHYHAETGKYTQGLDDVYFIISSMLGFTATRAIVIDWLFYPIATQLGLRHKQAVRFAEQGWLLVYYLAFWTYGMNIWYNSSYWFNFRAIWADWPTREVSGSVKLYCLLQLSFWAQQIFVIHIEAKRKDHSQMFIHHIITSTLLGSAYVYSFYNVANVVLCLMDIVDYMLPFAKMLKYLGFERACTVAFGVFLGTWVIARHFIYMGLWWSIHKTVPADVPFGCYSGATGKQISTGSPDLFFHIFSPFLDLNGPICMTNTVKTIFLGMLLLLQVLSLIWLGMIIKVALGVIWGGSSAEDTRSDDEGEVDDAEPKEKATVSARNTNTSTSSEGTSWSRSVMANGSNHQSHPVRIRMTRGRVTLSDHNDRKTLLGRIGCDKST
ncbi:TLC domain-containing protein [Arthroderma uncinatum]|uniref:TLC domain-containing protein n=1 Tax=Arthroderma uncinatum TaxID=74035 RepID=UPI00144AA6CC|nr:TLC domain-containing protein [Arthroderma uncinatum]KAF3491966.1 TLC domain-containing protein [Arthroderma uncinatum]